MNKSACYIINSVDVETISQDVFEVNVYPNPANEMLTVDVLNQEFQEAISLLIADALGRLV